MEPSGLLKSPPRTPLVAASILSADFAHMGEQCRRVLDAGADLLHLDVMDGHFVPNLTMGPDMCGAVRHEFPHTCLDVHLMIEHPRMFVEPFAKAGATNFTFHIEAVPHPTALAKSIRDAGMSAGLAINPPTNVDAILPFIADFDLILVMSVNPGYSGQSFITSVLDKVRTMKPLLRPDQRLEMDGGISARTAADCVTAGCDVLVSASAIFDADDYAVAIDALRPGTQSVSSVVPRR